MTKATEPFHILFLGSHPDEGNDDAWMGNGYATLAEANADFEIDPMDLAFKWISERANAEPERRLNICDGQAQVVRDCAFVWLTGAGVDVLKENPHFVRKRRDTSDREWQREIAMEAGMLHGVDAYNEAMGNE